MKKLKLIFLIGSLVINTQLRGQSIDSAIYLAKIREIGFQPPIFLDSKKFQFEVQNKLNLKLIFDQLKKDRLLGHYMYTFAIDKKGKIEPKIFYDKDYSRLKEIHQFVIRTFNRYRWRPGHRKNCFACKKIYYLQLSIYLHTEKENNVVISIKDIETLKNLFYLEIPYANLKSCCR